jgi:hypothetical protein
VRTIPTETVEPPTDNGDESRPDYGGVLARRVEALPEPDRTVLRRRCMSVRPPTLQGLGDELFVTRERVRQIEERALRRVRQQGPERKPGRPKKVCADQEAQQLQSVEDDSVIAECIERLGLLPLPLTESAVVAAGFGPFDAPIWSLLLHLAAKAGHYRKVIVDDAGRNWLGDTKHTPTKLIAGITDAVREVGVVEDLVELWEEIEQRLRPHVGSDDEAEDIAADVVDGLSVIEVGPRCAIMGGATSVPERLVRILRAKGEPMKAYEIVPMITGRSVRTTRSRLNEEPRIVQVGPDEFALAEWGAKERPKLKDLVYGVIDEHGQVAVDHLERLAAEHLYKPSSIAFYSELPDLIEEAGVLRRRGAQDPPAVREPGLDGGCLRVVTGPQRGEWSTTIRINHRRLYHGPQKIPMPLAVILSVEPGSSGVPITINGEHVVHCTWGSYSYLFGGELRLVLDQLGFADGDLMRIVALPGEATITPVPPVDVADGPLGTLVRGAAVYDECGEPVPFDELSGSLAYAIGLAPDTPLIMVGRRLAARRNAELLAAFELVFAAELGA